MRLSRGLDDSAILFFRHGLEPFQSNLSQSIVETGNVF
jgi:hypothetical protein